MKKAGDVLKNMPGIDVPKPEEVSPVVIEELKSLAAGVGLDLSEEELVTYCVYVKSMAAEREACAKCSGLESCSLDYPGFVFAFSRGFRNRPSFAMRKCERRLSYEELVRNEELLSACNIPASLRQKSFKGFDPKENPEAYRVAVDVMQNTSRPGAIFFGPTGVGKTHLAAAILNNRIIKGGVGIYATVPDLMDSLRSAMRKDSIDEAREALIESDFLFLDDIGAENPTDFVVEELFKIVNGRCLRGKQMVGTSNLSMEGLRERYAGVGGARIVSRLSELCEWVEMSGQDRRM